MSDFENLLPPYWQDTIRSWLKEDIPSFDYGGYVVGSKDEIATLYGKSEGIVAGVPFFTEVFSVEWKLNEGDKFSPVVEVAKVYGTAKDILQGERLALNIISRCSAIAYKGYRLNQLKEQNKFNGLVAGTRKTTPGFRLVEKYGMLVGGLDTHRMDLSTMTMLKDNHVHSQGSITAAVNRARKVGGFSIKIEVECSDKSDAEEAIQAGADIVMLDNLVPPQLHVVAAELKEKFEADYKFLIEASGGIDESTIAPYFNDAIDIISLGSVTQGVFPHVDYSLKLKPRE